MNTVAPGAPLLLAVRRYDSREVARLLADGAPHTARTLTRATALHLAVRYDDGAVRRLLLAAGADVHATCQLGWTPLHDAAAFGMVDCVVDLLAAGADARARTFDGHTAAKLAECNWCTASLAPLLRDAEAAAARWSGLRRAVLTAWVSAPVGRPSP